MTFDELIDIEPTTKVADIIQLFLLGYDDKIYLNLCEDDKYILKSERINHIEWQPYYECKLKRIEEEGYDPYDELASITLFI